MTIRPATAADVPAVRTLCALAYRDDPLMRWVLPDDATRADACAAWLGPSLERYLAAGGLEVLTVDSEVAAVAAWRPPVDRHAGTRTWGDGPRLTVLHQLC